MVYYLDQLGRHNERYHTVTCLPTHSLGVKKLATGIPQWD